MLAFYIILIGIIIIGIISIFYLSNSSLIKNKLFRIKEAENLIAETLEKKLKFLSKANKIIKEKTDLKIDMFDEIEKLKINNSSYVQVDRKLTSFHNTILQIKTDYSSLDDNRSLKNILKDIKSENEKLEAAKKFYNKYVLILRELRKNLFRKLVFKSMKLNDYQLYSIKITNREVTGIDYL